MAEQSEFGGLKLKWQRSKAKAKHENKFWSLDVDELCEATYAQERCALSGIDFVYKKGSPYFPSADRIWSEEDYHWDNVQIVGGIFNIMKNNQNDHDFINHCRHVVMKSMLDRGLDPKNCDLTKEIDVWGYKDCDGEL